MQHPALVTLAWNSRSVGPRAHRMALVLLDNEKRLMFSFLMMTRVSCLVKTATTRRQDSPVSRDHEGVVVRSATVTGH